MKRLRKSLSVAVCAAAGAWSVSAQLRNPPPFPIPPRGEARGATLAIRIPPPVPETPVPFAPPRPDGEEALQPLSFVSPDVLFERRLVRGAPFAAETLIESAQTLPDGNRITRRSRARIYRDAEGRTRRDHLPEEGGDEPRVSVLSDPVAGGRYTLDHRRRTASRVKLPPDLFAAPGANADERLRFGIIIPPAVARRRMSGQGGEADEKPRHEKLGQQQIEGVAAEGRRVVFTVPAGEFGNTQPMEISYEYWRAAELQIVVLVKHSDPRFGETVFRLTNLSRTDPARALFELPAGYKVVEGFAPEDFPVRRRAPRF